jgi:hypothetical protein
MSNIIVDVEADGQAPGLFSMVSFGAVILSEDLDKTFYGQCKPLPDADWDENALSVSGHSRQEVLTFPDPAITMKEFATWIEQNSQGRAIFWADNNGFDWQFINYYFWRFYGSNPFGFSSQNINSLYKGITRDMYASFKHLRKTKHTHHPVDDAKGNGEALLAMRDDKRLKIRVDK